MTVEELASYLKLKPRTLYPKFRAGQMPAIKIFGQWRFKKSDIDKWLSENTKVKTGTFATQA